MYRLSFRTSGGTFTAGKTFQDDAELQRAFRALMDACKRTGAPIPEFQVEQATGWRKLSDMDADAILLSVQPTYAGEPIAKPKYAPKEIRSYAQRALDTPIDSRDITVPFEKLDTKA